MGAEGANSEQAQHVHFNSTQVDAGNFERDGSQPAEEPGHHGNSESSDLGVQQPIQQWSAAPNSQGDGIRNVTPESNQDDPEGNKEPQSDEPQTSQPVWSKVLDRVRGSQHNKTYRPSHRRPSNAFYTQVHGGSLENQEKSSDPHHESEQNHEDGEDGSGQLHYTKTAAETVNTFLGHNVHSTYSMAAK